MRVWIDQGQCTSSGLCEVIAPDIFEIRPDGLAHLLAESDDGPGGDAVKYGVLPGQEDVVREAAEQCPGECIHVEE